MPTLRNRECEKHHLKRTLNGWCTTSNKRISFDTAFFVLIQIVLTFSFVLRLMRFSKQQRQFNKTASAPERQTHIYIQQLRTFQLTIYIYIHSERCNLMRQQKFSLIVKSLLNVFVMAKYILSNNYIHFTCTITIVLLLLLLQSYTQTHLQCSRMSGDSICSSFASSI